MIESVGRADKKQSYEFSNGLIETISFPREFPVDDQQQSYEFSNRLKLKPFRSRVNSQLTTVPVRTIGVLNDQDHKYPD